MDSLKRSPAKNTKSTETANTTTYQVVGELTNQRGVVVTGAGAYDFSRMLLLVESFGIFVHVTRTCRETPAPAPSQRARFALGVTQRRRRRSSAWHAFSRLTEPFPSGRSWRGTNWTMRDSGKLFEVVAYIQKNDAKTFVFYVRLYTYHVHVLSASFRRPDASRSVGAVFRVRYLGYVC